jgi:GNAT superfamily N-acetyltransferase
MGRPVIKPVCYSEILDAPNAQGLLAAYASECSLPEIGRACPKASQYELLEAAGALHTFGVYEQDELIGFAAVLLAELPHYSRKVATIESIFIHPDHRESGVGMTLMLVVEQFADVQGCAAVLYSAPSGSRFEKLLSYLPQYRNTNSVYCRSLA